MGSDFPHLIDVKCVTVDYHEVYLRSPHVYDVNTLPFYGHISLPTMKIANSEKN